MSLDKWFIHNSPLEKQCKQEKEPCVYFYLNWMYPHKKHPDVGGRFYLHLPPSLQASANTEKVVQAPFDLIPGVRKLVVLGHVFQGGLQDDQMPYLDWSRLTQQGKIKPRHNITHIPLLKSILQKSIRNQWEDMATSTVLKPV